MQLAAGLAGLKWALTDGIDRVQLQISEDETPELALDLDTGTDVE